MTHNKNMIVYIILTAWLAAIILLPAIIALPLAILLFIVANADDE